MVKKTCVSTGTPHAHSERWHLPPCPKLKGTKAQVGALVSKAPVVTLEWEGEELWDWLPIAHTAELNLLTGSASECRVLGQPSRCSVRNANG